MSVLSILTGYILSLVSNVIALVSSNWLLQVFLFLGLVDRVVVVLKRRFI